MEIENSSNIYSNSAGSRSIIRTLEYLPSGSLSSHQESVEYTDGESELPNQHIFFHDSSIQGVIPYKPHTNKLKDEKKVPISLRSLDIIQDHSEKAQIEETSSEYSQSLLRNKRLGDDPREMHYQSEKSGDFRVKYDLNQARKKIQFLVNENSELKQSITTYSLKFEELEKKLKKSKDVLKIVQERLDFIENHSKMIIKSVLESVGKTKTPIDMYSSSLFIDVLKILQNKSYKHLNKIEKESMVDAPKRYSIEQLYPKTIEELPIEDFHIKYSPRSHKDQFIDYSLDKTFKGKINRECDKSNAIHDPSEIKEIFTYKNVFRDLKEININSVKALKDTDISRRSLNFKFSNLLNKS